MMTDNDEKIPEGQSPKRRELQHIQTGEIPTIYANSVSFRTSVWDVTMDLGLIMEINDERTVVHKIASLIMSPQHAKVFSQLLSRNIARYEEQFGDLGVEADLGEETPPVSATLSPPRRMCR